MKQVNFPDVERVPRWLKCISIKRTQPRDEDAVLVETERKKLLGLAITGSVI